ncbi:MAG: prolyl oligopeptidase family serine peptidase [Pseudomonadota bacterium]
MRLSLKSCAGFLCLACVLTMGQDTLFAAETGTNKRLQPGPYAVGKQDFRLVDSSRTTAAHNGNPEASQRVLETSVWYPAQNRPFEWLRPGPRPLTTDVCPAPLVIYSHGFMSFRSNGAYLARYLARHGYIVAAANFPLTRFGTPGGPQFTDVINQPGDVSFIIDSLLGWSETAENHFAGCIDRERIAAVGLSLGGLTTTLLAFHPEYRDTRTRAAVSIAGPVALLGKDFFGRPSIPFMMIASNIDAMVDYQRNAVQFRTWVPEATLVTLQGGSHTGFAGMAARLFRWVDNPDSVGCWAMRGTLDDALDVPDNFTSKLRGKKNETLTDLELIPCRDPELPTALRPQHQQRLTKQAVLSFLQSQFHPDAETRNEYRKILEQSLAQDNPEVEVNSGR